MIYSELIEKHEKRDNTWGLKVVATNDLYSVRGEQKIFDSKGIRHRTAGGLGSGSPFARHKDSDGGKRGN